MDRENFDQVNEFRQIGDKKLRFGYTTGSCSAAAAKAAALMLLGNRQIETVELETPKGIGLVLSVHEVERQEDWVSCAVKKNSGDDPDVTNGILIYAKLVLEESDNQIEILLDGGIGVGRVTKPGLEVKIGEAAINRVPREMIRKEVLAVCKEFGMTKGRIRVTISVPEGVEISKKTFNERLGIVGGISILGTSGIVEPMSDEAWIDSIKVEMDIMKAEGQEVIAVTLGNYGEDFLINQQRIPLKDSLKCSNFIGATIDYASEIGMKGILLVGHIGKLIKTAGGIMNTHSKHGDCRMEIIASHAGMAGMTRDGIREIMSCVTVDDAIHHLNQEKLLDIVMESILERIDFYLGHRCFGKFPIGAVVFSNQYGVLGETEQVAKLLEMLS